MRFNTNKDYGEIVFDSIKIDISNKNSTINNSSSIKIKKPLESNHYGKNIVEYYCKKYLLTKEILNKNKELSEKEEDDEKIIKELSVIFQQLKGKKLNKSMSIFLWETSEHIHNLLVDNSESHRVNELGEPYHPLEEELLDIIDGKKTTLSLSGKEIPIEYYTNRKKIDGKKEKHKDFLNRVYVDYIEANVLYSTYLAKIDISLYNALCKSKEGISTFLPLAIDKTNQLCNRAVEKNIQVESISNMINNRKKHRGNIT